jgi:hypothetical protein
MFRVKALAECLEAVNVNYEIVEGAILIDTEALGKVKKSAMPHFLFMNYDWIMGC